MKIEKLLSDYGITHVSSGHKHCRTGWVNISCPFCSGNPGFHGGFNLDGGNYHCWRCGSHPPLSVISALIRCGKSEAYHILKKYQGKNRNQKPARIIKNKNRKPPVKLPGNFPLNKKCQNYLSKRGLDPQEIEQIWDVVYSGPVGAYKHRIIAPIFQNGEIISYQGRDITGKQDPKYKACPQEIELIEHQTTIYGEWLIPIKKKILVVEGLFDTWKMGIGSGAVFGIDFTMSQITKLLQYEKIYIMFDDGDPQAKKQAKKMAGYLSSRREVEIVSDYGAKDPGELTKKQAVQIMEELL